MGVIALKPPHLVLNPAHYPRGTRLADVLAGYRAQGYRVEWCRFQLIATRLH